MGMGDWIMATAQVKQISERNGGRKVCVVGRSGQPQWSEIFENNPRISRTANRYTTRLVNGPGVRPYIAAKTETHWTWKQWAITTGELFLTKAEHAFAAPHRGLIMVEPLTKVADSNKAWIWDRWQELVYRIGVHRFIQAGPSNVRRLDNVMFVETPTFRHACALLSVSKAFVGTEGGLHHAAAALGLPAVVLFSEFISPDITGYASHRNLRHAGPACGSRLPCPSCKASMEAITVDEVQRNLEEIT